MWGKCERDPTSPRYSDETAVEWRLHTGFEIGDGARTQRRYDKDKRRIAGFVWTVL